MCGILGGVWAKQPQDFEQKIQNGLEKLQLRGPDDRGFELFEQEHATVLFGHTRLSIIDTSSGGHQPMHSHDGKYSIVFNGEIYNYKELKVELQALGWEFKTQSDTEVLVCAWQQWQEACLPKLNGMFAFVVLDKAAQTLTCVRDPFGIKPFFYSPTKSNGFRYASDVNALLELLDDKPDLNYQRVYDYLVFGDYDTGDKSFYDNVFHLPPGHLLKVDLTTLTPSVPVQWWSANTQENAALSYQDAVEKVRSQFLEDIRFQLRSDVPLGAALSGGIDSSAVVCSMRHVEPDIEINTFSYIAGDERLSEEKWVDLVNNHVSAKSYKTKATPEELLSDLDDLIISQGEPFGSTSIYAQYKVFKLAKENGVTVTLDGQGADELFAGYNGYPYYRIQSLVEKGQLINAAQFALNWSQWPGRSKKEALMCLGGNVLPEFARAKLKAKVNLPSFPAWIDKDFFAQKDVSFVFKRLPQQVENKGRRLIEELEHEIQRKGLTKLLRHGDRNSMRFSVESRVPFLTPNMANLALSLPESYLVSQQGASKHIFRDAMRGIVPDAILDRKDKIGFATPEEIWLKKIAPTLRTWLEDSQPIPFIDKNLLLADFDAIMSGQKPFTWQVWRWVNFVRWFAHYTQK
ncbi:Asparagine synthetase [glutamine-hydrolyzing] [Pseudoalteromonas luteoviolacea B = ATCC 29581]|nr:Asparagine synthetase [glutamine-hydrolyzing] [Pseudoalteromonas luteoviolacea B = ATCC 29581]